MSSVTWRLFLASLCLSFHIISCRNWKICYLKKVSNYLGYMINSQPVMLLFQPSGSQRWFPRPAASASLEIHILKPLCRPAKSEILWAGPGNLLTTHYLHDSAAHSGLWDTVFPTSPEFTPQNAVWHNLASGCSDFCLWTMFSSYQKKLLPTVLTPVKLHFFVLRVGFWFKYRDSWKR